MNTQTQTYTEQAVDYVVVQSQEGSSKNEQERNPIMTILESLTAAEALKFLKKCNLNMFTESQWVETCRKYNTLPQFSFSPSNCQYNLCQYFSVCVAFERIGKRVELRRQQLGYGAEVVSEHRQKKIKILKEFGIMLNSEQRDKIYALETVLAIDNFAHRLISHKLG